MFPFKLAQAHSSERTNCNRWSCGTRRFVQSGMSRALYSVKTITIQRQRWKMVRAMKSRPWHVLPHSTWQIQLPKQLISESSIYFTWRRRTCFTACEGWNVSRPSENWEKILWSEREFNCVNTIVQQFIRLNSDFLPSSHLVDSVRNGVESCWPKKKPMLRKIFMNKIFSLGICWCPILEWGNSRGISVNVVHGVIIHWRSDTDTNNKYSTFHWFWWK